MRWGSEINLVLCEQLARVGFDTIIANNDKECLEIVRSCMKNDQKPVTPIFMDIHMPVTAAAKSVLQCCEGMIKYHCNTIACR